MTLLMLSSEAVTNRKASFLTYYLANESKLSAYVRSHIRNWNDAEEVMQETCIRLWKQFDDFDTERSFIAWSKTIAHFQILSYWKNLSREKTRQAHLVAKSYERDLMQDEYALERREHKIRILASSLLKLDQSRRELLLYYYEDPGSIRQLAEKMDVSYESLRKIIHRSRKKLALIAGQKLQQELEMA